ncbi:Trypsin-4 [Chlorella vulgaris]
MFLLFIFLLAPGAIARWAPDVNVSVGTYILDGQVDSNNELFPYAAYIERTTDTSVLMCSGSLVSATHVVTAAHCLDPSNPAGLAIRIRGDWFQASSVHVPDDFDRDFLDRHGGASNDIGIIELDRPSDVPPVSLPRSSMLAAGTRAYTAGFGGDGSELSYALVDVRSDCPSGFVDQFCAGGTDGSACTGDSGGPVVLETDDGDVLVGLTSWGSADCSAGFAYYTSVVEHADDLEKWMGISINIEGNHNTVVIGNNGNGNEIPSATGILETGAHVIDNIVTGIGCLVFGC